MGKSGNPAKRAEQEAAAQTDEAPVYEPVESADEFGTEDFDAFWEARNRKRRRTNIMGQSIELPASLPLQFEMEARRVERSRNEDDIKRLVGILAGPDALDGWIERGLDAEQFAVLLAWLPRVIVGQKVTLAEIADAIASAQDGDTDTDPQ
jgi:hypothetical protein